MEKKLMDLCIEVKADFENGHWKESRKKLTEFMKEYPDSPVPHNLMGIWYEKQYFHVEGMKHFRAAWALDPAFLPVRVNLNRAASVLNNKKMVFAYLEEDCQEEIKKPKKKLVFDKYGIGHMEVIK